MSTLLVITVFLPMVGACALFLLPRLNYKTARNVAIGTALVTLLFTALFVLAFEKPAATEGPSSPPPPQFVFEGENGYLGLPWISVVERSGNPGPGIRFALGLDGISLWLFALTSLLMITSVFASWESVKERAATHYALMLALATGLLGLFASLDVVLFYIFFEFTLIPLFFLIGLYGGPERRRASIMFFLYTLAGSLLTLIGVLALVLVHQAHSADQTLTFSIPELTRGLANLRWADWQYDGVHPLSWTSPQVLIFLLLFAGFAIKVPLFPFHTWLPLAHVEAPTAGSILLAGVLLKVGSYGFLRFNLGMTPHGAHALLPMLATICIIGIIYGALTALAQSDVKRLVAYSSVSHMGFIALGLFSLTSIGLDGAVIQMVNHGLTTGALFACVGVVYERYHTREMGQMEGIWNRLPLLAFFWILAALGSAALPGLNGFVGEFPILLAMFSRHPVYGVLAATGMVLGAYYLMVMLQRVLFGPLRVPHAQHGEGSAGHGASGHATPSVRPVGWHEIAGLAPLMVFIVLIGVYPRPFFETISPAARQIAAGFPALPAAAAPAPAPAASHVAAPRERVQNDASGRSLVKLQQDRAR
jgi:NADH-quinone oxidoreductase subunit M